MTVIRPMLAASFEDPQNIEPELVFLGYPLLASPKIDGFRFLAHEGVAMSRSWKPLPNRVVQEFFKIYGLHGLDGEIVVGDDPAAPGIFNLTQSAIMTRDAQVKFSLHIFDRWDKPNEPFNIRHESAKLSAKNFHCASVDHRLLTSPEEVLKYEEEAIAAGYEGIMLREPLAKYKYGRSTLKQQGLIKVKRFLDDEATIIGFMPLMRNENLAQLDAFGLQKRSSHKANKRADELMGKLLVGHPKWGQFSIGSGFDVDLRAKIWANPIDYIGKKVTYKYQAHGSKDAPRMPIFKGFRPEID